MCEYSLPPAPNWFSSGALRGSPLGYVAYASHNQIVILSVPEVKVVESDNWRDGGPTLNPPKTFIINDAHEDKTKVCSVAWNPDPGAELGKQILVSSGDDGNVRLWKWSPSSHSLVGQHTIHSENKSKVFGLDWSKADPNLVVSADETGCLVSWDLMTNRTKKYFFGKTCVYGLALHPEDSDLAGFGCKLGLVFIVSLAGTGRLIHKMRGHDEDCFSVSWCPTQGSDWQMVSSSRDKTLRVWSFTEGKSVQKIKLPSSGKGRGNASSSFVCCVWLDEHRILASGENGELVLANLDTVGRKEKEGVKVDLLHKEHFKALFSIGVSRGVVYSVGQDRIVPAFDLGARRLLYSLPTLNGFAYSLASNPVDPSIIALGAGDGIVRIWRTAAKQLFDVRQVKLNQSKVMSLAWHPDREGLLGFGTDEGRVGWFDAFTNKTNVSFSNFQHRSGVYSCTWGPPISGEGGLCLYSVGDGRLVQHNTNNSSFVDLFSKPEHKTANKPNVSQSVWRLVAEITFLLLGLDDGSVDIYRVPGLKLVGSLKSHKKLIQSLVFHPDCLSSGAAAEHVGWLAVASNETSIHLWDLETTLSDCGAEGSDPVMLVTPTATLDAHFQRVIELAWNPHQDGILISISYDSSVQVWDINTLTPLHNFQGHTKRLMCCMWHPTQTDLVMSGGEDCCLAVWRPVDQPNSRPVQRKPQKKRGRQPDIAQPKMCETGGSTALSFEQLLDQHRQHQQQQKQPPTEEDGPMNAQRNDGPALGLRQRNDGPPGFRQRNDEPFRESSVPDSRGSEKKRRRATKKSYFPSSSRTEAVSSATVAEDCLGILEANGISTEQLDDGDATEQLCNGVNSLKITKDVNKTPGRDELAYLGFFYGCEGMKRLLDTEILNVEESSHRATISLWTGNLAEFLKTAEAEGHLTEALVAQSAGLSQVIWRRTAGAYANQLSKEGHYLKASEFYLAVHMVLEAIEVLRKNGAFQPALAIALSRLPENDPVVRQLLVGLAAQAGQDGNLPLAAKCWTAVGDRVQAAEILAKMATRESLGAAAVISEDHRRSEMYAKQCLTECLMSQDREMAYRLAERLPSLGWGALLISSLKEINTILKQTNPTSEPGPSLLCRLETLCRDHKLSCDVSSVSAIQEFVRTTNAGDKTKTRQLAVAGHIAAALAARSEPQLCLNKVSLALGELHDDPSSLERMVGALFPKGTQPIQVGEALLGTALDWQCSWPELRSIQCSEAVAILHSKKTAWDEDVMVDVADAFMLEDVLFCQKLAAEIKEGEAAVADFDPEKEKTISVVGDEAEEEREQVDFTPSLTGTQTISLAGDGNWKSEGLTSEIPLPPGGLENLPPPPKQTTSFYIRFLRGKPDTVGATKEIQKLKWILSKQSALVVVYPDLTECCRKLLALLLEHNLGKLIQMDDGENETKISFSQKLARFGYYKGARLHQEFFLQHS